MVVAARAEAVITAQNKLKPGLAAAAADLNRFQAMQRKTFTAFSSNAARASSVAAQKSAAAMVAAQARIGMASRGAIAAIAAPAALSASYKQFADVDRQISRIGVTANASGDQLAGVRKQIEGIAYETAQSAGSVTSGLDVLVAQGRSLKEGLDFLPAVARTAAAANAEVSDIAKTADAVASNFKLAGKEVQLAFDLMAEGGKAGQFELKDMAQYLPSLSPAASAAGFRGTKGLTDLVSMLQILRKGSGSSQEASDSMSNIFQKMESEETAKKFKKLGVDLAGAMAKGRKEGRNLVEVLEEVTAQATKGDLSKLPQLFSDVQFARGVRALMTYRGEWQKLANTISTTAPGSVARDLVKVTNDAKAQIDRMIQAVENRAVQLGGLLAKHVVLPLDEAVKKIERGENAVANRIEDFSKHDNADSIARSELDGGPKRQYDPAMRRLIDARKEFVQRENIDKKREQLGGQIETLRKQRGEVTADAERQKSGSMPASVRATVDAKAKLKTDSIDLKVANLQASLDGLNKVVAAIDEINLKLAESTGPLRQAAKPRMAQDVEAPAYAYVGPATENFGPNLGAGGSKTAVTYGGVPVATRLPPVRPDSLKPKPSSSEDIGQALSGAKGKVSEVKTGIEALGPAGASAGQALAAGITSGLSQADASVDAFVARTQQKLSGIKMPGLSVGGAGGLPTGKQGPN